MDSTVQSVLQFVEENDVKFIRLAFCDLMGNLKNVSILPGELAGAFETGVAVDIAAVTDRFENEPCDLRLFPDAATLSVLPWRPQSGRVMRLFCNIRNGEGEAFRADGRYVLQRAVNRLAEAGWDCRMGTKCEFYLFLRDEQGRPTQRPQDEAGYLDVAPLDGGENVRREICLTLEEMSLRPSMSHHEQGPGQNEIDFRRAAPVTAADDVVTFKQVVRTVAANNGLFASFGPKPLAGQPGSGMHIHIAPIKDGRNLFAPDENGRLSEQAASFMTGIVERAPELCAFTNPMPDSYARLKDLNVDPDRGSIVRWIAGPTPEKACLEVRLPDAACEPYLTFALLLTAGLEGMEHKRIPGTISSWWVNRAGKEALEKLPASIEEAVAKAEDSKFVREVLQSSAMYVWLKRKRKELDRFAAALDTEAIFRAANFSAL